LEDKKVSLNEEERKVEKNTEKKRVEERKQTIKAMSKTSPSILNITFDNLQGSTEAPKVTGMKARLEEDEDADGKPDEEPTPAESFAADLHLREALRILSDYIASIEKKAPKTSVATKP
jgi:predicted component of viral defense system (DUF524 family)